MTAVWRSGVPVRVNCRRCVEILAGAGKKLLQRGRADTPRGRTGVQRGVNVAERGVRDAAGR